MAEQRRAKDDSGEQFADHGGLPQPLHDIRQQPREHEQQGELDQEAEDLNFAQWMHGVGGSGTKRGVRGLGGCAFSGAYPLAVTSLEMSRSPAAASGSRPMQKWAHLQERRLDRRRVQRRGEGAERRA